MRIAVIGTGSMGSALLGGILQGGHAPGEVIATTQSTASAQALAARLGVSTLAAEADPAANRSAVADADIVLVGVKPWMMADTLTDIAPALPAGALVVSMAAGFSLAQMQKLVPANPLARIMPNTPAQIGLGVIALAPGASVTAEQTAALSTLLSGAGKVFTVTEEQIGAMTAISGSGVAYFFLLAEHLVSTGVDLGLDADTARDMVVQTALGAGSLLARNPDPAALRKAVTSKGGTTHAAIETFAAHDFAATVKAAGKAAQERSEEMERENENR